MKTVKAHLETLPEPYRSKALANAAITLLDHPVASIYQALDSFVWEETEEGSAVWIRFANKLAIRDRIIEKLNTIDTRRYTSKQVVDELKRWAKEI